MLTATAARWHRVPRRRSDRDGYTLIEVVVVVAILMVVLVMFLDSLTSLTNTSQRVQSLVTNEETVRFALDQMERDVRGAVLLDPEPTAGAYRDQLRFEVGPTASRTYLRWLYDTTPASPTYESVIRQVMAGATSTSVLSQTVEITRVENLGTNTPTFTYFDSHEVDLVSQNSPTPANVADCAISVHIQVDADSQPGPQPFSETIDVELRNRLPGGIIGCPS
jgi:type II secretory pathway pseudopilin PulG